MTALRPVRAPGRVNLIGGHVDYHDGWVLPMAIDREVRLTGAARADGRVVVRSSEYAGTVDVAADGSDEPQQVEPAWGRAVAGVARTLARRGRPPLGARLDVSSTLPIGGGLSSSAAFEIAVARALCDAAHFTLAERELVVACQEAEHLATGVPCGIQDQAAALCARAGHAMLLDCRTFEIDHVPMPDGVRVLIVHSGVPRTLEASPYAQRRAEGEQLARHLGLPALRDARPEQVQAHPRGRHAVSEMRRVLEFADALREGDVARCGDLMLASHASLRDDMEVSTPELDALVDLLVEHGAYGARLTGGGFGGCVVALVDAADADAVAGDVTARYRARTGREPFALAVTATAGSAASA